LRRALSRLYCPTIPVVCVGSLVVGGAGKTPVALAMTSYLAARGIEVHVVTRGYGGHLRGPVQVDPLRHDADAVGDEALLLAARAPCWVARDRAAGARAAVAVGARTVVLDDGFQNPAIAKTLSFIVVDAGYGFGNGRVIPAGPLRESAGERLAGSRLLAFAGIGRPEKFFATLRALDAVIVGARAFPDHYPFRAGEIERLHREAEQARARLVTTAKDIVRVPQAQRAGIEVLEVEIRWPDPAALAGLIGPVVLSALGNGRGSAD